MPLEANDKNSIFTK